MKLCFVIASPAWDERRAPMLERLESTLRAQCAGTEHVLVVHRHPYRLVNLAIAEVLQLALETDATHLVTLPDDAILVPNFVRVVENLVRAKPDAIIDCLSNHPDAEALAARGCDWYSSDGGSCMFGGIMRAEMWREMMAFRATAVANQNLPYDNCLNLWAMKTRRPVWKPLPSPVQHDLSFGSLNGNEQQPTLARTSQAFDGGADLSTKDWGGKSEHVGLTFQGQHWDMVFSLHPSSWDIERMYEVARGEPVNPRPHLFIATPAYQPPELSFLASRDAAIRALTTAGVEVTVLTTNGDSLVTRGRHCIMHEFLQSKATHLLQWDADLELLTPEAAVNMLRSGFDVVGGAYPFRDGSGRVVVNLRADDLKKGTVDIDENGFMPLAEIGTGFLMTSRKAIVDLCMAHPERLYEADIEPHREAPMFALFDAGIRKHPLKDRMRYLSEDWEFCRLWRELGHEVWCYAPAEFRHWGKMGHSGSIQKALNMRPVEAAKEAAE